MLVASKLHYKGVQKYESIVNSELYPNVLVSIAFSNHTKSQNDSHSHTKLCQAQVVLLPEVSGTISGLMHRYAPLDMNELLLAC